MPHFDEKIKIPVSVIIPCYNCSQTIYSTVESVFRQTRLPGELLLINDASSDDGKTAAALKVLQSQWGSVMDILIIDFEENQGPAAARNAGWEKAVQPYIAFLDADDVWHPQKLELVYAVAEQNPDMDLIGHDFSLSRDREDAGMVYPAVVLSEIVRKGFYSVLLFNPFVTPSFFLKRNFPERFNPRLRYCEDHEFLLRVANSGKVYCLKTKLVQLGREAFTAGGLSAERFSMRKGEIVMYREAMQYRPVLVVFLPLLILFSVIKHVILLGLSLVQRKTVSV